MTRKDYILIADVLRERHYCLREDVTLSDTERNNRLRELELTAENLAYKLEDDNSRFDCDHFLAVVRGERELQSRPPRKAA
jgi:hypothetical protein